MNCTDPKYGFTANAEISRSESNVMHLERSRVHEMHERRGNLPAEYLQGTCKVVSWQGLGDVPRMSYSSPQERTKYPASHSGALVISVILVRSRHAQICM